MTTSGTSASPAELVQQPRLAAAAELGDAADEAFGFTTTHEDDRRRTKDRSRRAKRGRHRRAAQASTHARALSCAAPRANRRPSAAVGRRRDRSAGRRASTAFVRLRSSSCLRVEPVTSVQLPISGPSQSETPETEPFDCPHSAGAAQQNLLSRLLTWIVVQELALTRVHPEIRLHARVPGIVVERPPGDPLLVAHRLTPGEKRLGVGSHRMA